MPTLDKPHTQTAGNVIVGKTNGLCAVGQLEYKDYCIHILTDVSTSMRDDLHIVTHYIEPFLWSLCARRNTADRVRLSCFAGSTRSGRRLGYRTSPEYVRICNPLSVKYLRRFMRTWIGRGNTALYDAVILVHHDTWVFSSRHNPHGLNLLIVITDGDDDDSNIHPSRSTALQHLQVDLALIGLGRNTERSLRELQSYAASSVYISHPSHLLYALEYVLREAADSSRDDTETTSNRR